MFWEKFVEILRNLKFFYWNLNIIPGASWYRKIWTLIVSAKNFREHVHLVLSPSDAYGF